MAACVVATLLFRAGVAAAQSEHRVSLTYAMDPGLDGCPSRSEFQTSVIRQLGYDPFADEAVRQVVVRAVSSPSGLQGQLLWRDGGGQLQGERQLAAKHQDCRELARSMAFAIVVQLQLLDASADEPKDTRSTEPVSERPARIDGSDVASPERLPPPEPSHGGVWSSSIGVGASVATGLAPGASLLGRAFGSVRLDAVSLELGASASWPSTERDADGRGFRSNVLLGTFAPCLHVDRFSGCALAQVGQLRVRGLGVDEARSPSGTLAQLGLRLSGSQPLGPLVVSLRLEGLRTLNQWTVQVNSLEVWQVPSTSVTLGFDVALPIHWGP